MLNENQINALPERIAERLRQINTEYLESIGAVIKNIGELRPKDVHQLQQMYDYGADLNKITLKLAEASKKNVSEIYEIFDIVAKENYNYARPFYDAKAIPFIPYDDNKDLKQYVKSLAKQTVDEYVNITQHTAFAVFDKTGKDIAPLFDSNIGKKATSLSDTYTKIVDYAVTKVQLGEESYESAMRGAMKALVNSGIRDISYASGYSRRLDTAVRQNILWGIKECNQNVADMVGEEFGADGYEVSYHSHPRPTHEDMGGQQYAKGPARTINGVYYPSFEEEALPLLNEFHCLHFKFSILLGVSKPAYDKKTLEKLKAEDKKTFEFEGKTYTKYEASQIQRKLETSIRYQRDLLDIAKAAADNDLELEARDKINILLNKYSKFSDASGLPTKLERTRLAVTSKDVDKSVKSGIINSRFNSLGDPMLEVLGPAEVSHPKEIEKFRIELKELGVRVIEREREDLGYTPGLFPGEKGELHISKGASYSAWCHEMQHMREDYANGWQGMRILQDVEEHYMREVRAYQIEIDMAEKLERLDIAERLRENLRKERAHIYGENVPL